MVFGLIITSMGSSTSRLWADRSTLRLDRREPYLRIQHVTIFVRDQDRSLRFYVDQLGFSLVADYRYGSTERWIAVAPPDGSTIPFTSFEDVDGNFFALVSFDQVSREIEAQRTAIGENLESERRAAQELEIAKQVQARFFSQRLPPVRTLDYTVSASKLVRSVAITTISSI
jgi:catechol 2,3-dioxygenase-like lactoylglutathione lyase family enzyme